MQNRSFAQYLHFRDFEILESRKHSGCYGSEVTKALIFNKIPGFAKPSIKVLIHAVWTTKNRNSIMSRDNKMPYVIILQNMQKQKVSIF